MSRLSLLKVTTSRLMRDFEPMRLRLPCLDWVCGLWSAGYGLRAMIFGLRARALGF